VDLEAKLARIDSKYRNKIDPPAIATILLNNSGALPISETSNPAGMLKIKNMKAYPAGPPPVNPKGAGAKMSIAKGISATAKPTARHTDFLDMVPPVSRGAYCAPLI